MMELSGWYKEIHTFPWGEEVHWHREGSELTDKELDTILMFHKIGIHHKLQEIDGIPRCMECEKPLKKTSEYTWEHECGCVTGMTLAMLGE